ncbi:MAG: ssl1498 family light-harvesting-like protein [Xenococcaceae cyanobacterium MO_188.B19]|nr:ssl1498 family light-harvesting-like protein [Xenococcaceae cyanobacterium MO_188.B19]
MTTITDENGILNNFAKEPKMYYAKAPSSQEKRNYLLWGIVGLVVVTASVWTAAVVS